MKQKSRYNTARKMLIFWTLFIGIGAVAGATGMLVDPTGKSMGMDAMLPFFKVLPFADVLFNDLFFSGIALLIVNGLSNLHSGSFAAEKEKTRRNSRRDFRRYPYALDMHPVLYVSAQFYVDDIFHFRFFAGGNGICGICFFEAGDLYGK